MSSLVVAWGTPAHHPLRAYRRKAHSCVPLVPEAPRLRVGRC
jgi:hypothetical protein